jgi:hypothetical protein
LPFLCLSNKFDETIKINDIDIYTTNAVLLIKEFKQTFNIINEFINGVTITYNIKECKTPV